MHFETQSVTRADDRNSVLGFIQLLDDHDYVPPERGQVLKGMISQVSDKEIILDVGLKRNAIVPRNDLERLDDGIREQLIPGKEVKTVVLAPYSSDGELLVSINKALDLEDWERAQALLEAGEAIEARVVGTNRGGLLIRFGRLEGFVPNSHIVSIPRGVSSVERENTKTELIGQTLRFKIIEVTQQQQRLVVSEREARQAERYQRLMELEVGQIITGTVVYLVHYGAFVDLGGADGLIHISKLSHYYIDSPAEELDIGDEVTVLITKIDIGRQRVSLDRRALLPSPYAEFAEQHAMGDLLTGVVSNVVEYGIFVRVADGVHGLVHISNMSLYGIIHPEEIFGKGDEVLVRMLRIDPERNRITLSLDAVTLEEQQEWMHQQQESEMAVFEPLSENLDMAG